MNGRRWWSLLALLAVAFWLTAGQAQAQFGFSPGPPTSFEEVPGASTETSVTVRWQPPTDDGGSPITGYFVYEESERFSGGFNIRLLPSTARTHTIGSLAANTAYTFYAEAVNADNFFARPGEFGRGATLIASTGGSTKSSAPSMLEEVADTRTSSSISVRWMPPTRVDEGVTVVGYRILDRRTSRPPPPVRVSAETRTHTFSSLFGSREYTFAVAARIRLSNGQLTEGPLAEVTIRTAGSTNASAPTMFKEVANSRTSTSITVQWQPPARIDSGWTIRGYIVHGLALPARSSNLLRTTRTHTFTGLTPNTEYTYAVAAYIETSRSVTQTPLSASLTIRTNMKSGPPTMFEEVPDSRTNASLTVRWMPPANLPAGTVVRGYQVDVQPRPPFTSIPDLSSSARFYTVTRVSQYGAFLSSDTEYTITVRALLRTGGRFNAESQFTPGLTIRTKQASNLPTMFEEVTGSRTTNRIVVRWMPPANLPTGTAVVGYRVEGYYEREGNPFDPFGRPGSSLIRENIRAVDLSARARTHTFSNLILDTEYNLTVQALLRVSNLYPASSRTSLLTTRTSAGATAPTMFEETPDTATDSGITVRWMPPASVDNGVTILGYRVDREPSLGSPVDLPSTARGYTFSGLAANTEYTYAVAARIRLANSNSRVGPAANLTARTIGSTQVSAPTMFEEVPGSRTATGLTLRWMPPTRIDDGVTIGGYRLFDPDHPTLIPFHFQRIPAETRSYTFRDLTPDTEYTFFLAATISGTRSESPLTAGLTIRTNALSSPPAMFEEVPDTRTAATITVRWMPPATLPAGAEVSGYRVDILNRSDTTFSDLPATARTYTFSILPTRFNRLPLSPDTEYTLAVQAVLRVNSLYNTVSQFTAGLTIRTHMRSDPPVMFEEVPDSRTDNSISVRWMPPTTLPNRAEIEGYVVRGPSVNSGNLPSTARTHTFENLSADTEYNLVVVARLLINSTVRTNSEPTTGLTIRTNKPLNPPTMFEQTPDSSAATTIAVRWMPPADIPTGTEVVGYQVRGYYEREDRFGAPGSQLIRVDIRGAGLPATARTHTFISLSPKTEYTLSVRAMFRVNSQRSTQSQFTYLTINTNTGTSAPAMFEEVPDSRTSGSITVRWMPPATVDAEATLTGYRVRRPSGSSSSSISSALPTTARTFTYTRLAANTEYSLFVVALFTISSTSETREGPPTATLTIRTSEQTSAPTMFEEVPDSRTNSSLSMRWMPPATLPTEVEVVGYRLEGQGSYFDFSTQRTINITLIEPNLPATTRTHTFSNLQSSTTYAFSVLALLERSSMYADQSLSTADLSIRTDFSSKSGPPTMFEEVPDTSTINSITVRWMPPTPADVDDNVEIVGYQVEGYIETDDFFGRQQRTNLPAAPELAATVRTHTFHGLSPNTEYKFVVQATLRFNSLYPAKGRFTSAVTASTNALSSAPTMFEEVPDTRTDFTITVRWMPPADIPTGTEVVRYQVQGYIEPSHPSFRRNYLPVPSQEATARTYTFSDLEPNTEYTLAVEAILETDGSARSASPITDPLIIRTKIRQAPNALARFSLAKSIHDYDNDASVTVSWLPPREEGVRAIVGYGISLDDGEEISLPITPLTYTFVGLTKTTRYSFRIRAYNLPDLDPAGAGVLRSIFVTTTSSSEPDVPTMFEVVNTTSTTITVRWMPPEDSGARPITSYLVSTEARAGFIGNRRGTSLLPDARTHTVSGLSPNILYDISIRARNFEGFGRNTFSERVYIRDVSTYLLASLTLTAARDMANAVPGVTLTWTAPVLSANQTLAGYELHYTTQTSTDRFATPTTLPTTGFVPLTLDTPTATNYLHANLTNNVTYTYRVRARITDTSP